jgi:predicted outer membrane protein
MVENHQKGVSLFQRQDQAKLGDAELQSFIDSQLPVLRRHLTRAQAIQKQLGGATR